MPLEVDRPDVLAAVTAVFERNEAALVANDVDTLDELLCIDGAWRGLQLVGRPGREDLLVAGGKVAEAAVA
jgi:hypothetical protein